MFFYKEKDELKVSKWGDECEDAVFFTETLTDEELRLLIRMIVERMKEISRQKKEETVKWDEQEES